MRQVDSALAVALSLPVTNLATCWRITANDGEQAGLTTHDVDIVIDGVTYRSSGVSETGATSTTNAEVDNIDLHGLIDNNDIASAQIFSKKYDAARVDVFQVDYTNPPATITASSVLWIKTGVVGDIDLENGRWAVEARSLLDLLTQTTTLKTSRLCRADFGDSNCRANLTLYQKTGVVVSISGRSILTDITLNSGDMANGKITFSARGVSFDVLDNSGGRLTLAENVEFDPVGASVTVTFGCNKWLDDCAKYNNVANFYGEPYVPDSDDWAAGYFNTVSV